MVKTWCTFITPWKQRNQTLAAYTTFIARHYLFYRALLTLLLKRLSLINLKPAVFEVILTTIVNAFEPGLLSILSQCDHAVKNEPLLGATMSPLSSTITEGMTVGMMNDE